MKSNRQLKIRINDERVRERKLGRLILDNNVAAMVLLMQRRNAIRQQSFDNKRYLYGLKRQLAGPQYQKVAIDSLPERAAYYIGDL